MSQYSRRLTRFTLSWLVDLYDVCYDRRLSGIDVESIAWLRKIDTQV